MRYYVQWGDPLGNGYLAEVFRPGDTDGELTRYAAGRNAFQLEEDDETDVMKAIRVTTAKLDVVAKVADLVVPTLDDEWRFRLRQNGVTVFTGWLKCEALEMALSSDYEEFTYTVIDDLECLKCRKMELAGLVKVGDLIAWCLVALLGNTGTRVYWGNGIYWEKDGQGLLNLMVNAMQWKTDDGYGDCQKVLEDIALSTGSTVRSCADGISFQTLRDTHYTVYEATVDAETGRPVLTAAGTSATAVGSQAVAWRGEHTLCVVPGRRHVTITTGGKAYELDGASLSGGELLGGGFHFDNIPFSSTSPYSFPFYWKGFGVDTDNDGKPLLEFTGTGDEEEFLPGVGSYCVDEDYWDTGSKEDPGSGSEAEGKRNVEFRRVLYVLQRRSSSDGEFIDPKEHYSLAETAPIKDQDLLESVVKRGVDEMANILSDKHFVRVTSTIGASSGSWLDLVIKFKLMTGKMVHDVNNNRDFMSPLKLSEPQEDDPVLTYAWIARLKIGEWYCNAGYGPWKRQPWQKESCTMLLKMEKGNFGKNEEWTLVRSIEGVNPSADTKGLGIPMPSDFTGGDLELTIFGAVTYSAQILSTVANNVWRHVVSIDGLPETAITSFSLSLSPPLRSDTKKETLIRRQRIDGSANDTVSATVPFCTGGIAPNCGMLMRRAVTAVDRVTDGTTTGTVADVLLAQYVAAYSHASFFVRLAVAFDPVRRRGGLHKVAWRGKAFPVVSSSVDTASGVETVTLWCGEALPEVPGTSGASMPDNV